MESYFLIIHEIFHFAPKEKTLLNDFEYPEINEIKTSNLSIEKFSFSWVIVFAYDCNQEKTAHHSEVFIKAIHLKTIFNPICKWITTLLSLHSR